MIHSPLYRFIQRWMTSWRMLARAIGWLLAVVVVHRRRAYFDLALAVLEALFHLLRMQRQPQHAEEFGF